MKFCVKCKEEKELSEFVQRKDRKNLYRNYCKECDSKRRKDFYKSRVETERSNARSLYHKNRSKNLVKMREGHLRRRYGIDKYQYENLLKQQDYKCAVCLEPAENFAKNLHVDHSHETNEIRGLLCPTCNRYFIGSQTTIEKFERAIKYLTKSHTKLFVPLKDNQ